MIPASIEHDINNYRAQLNQILSQNYVDQPTVLGFFAQLHGKLQPWIQADCRNFYQSLNEMPQAQQLTSSDFCSTELVRYLRELFHQPVLKFYQRAHYELYQASMSPGAAGKPKFRPVEMRKLNDQFKKFVKSVKQFYRKVLSDLCNTYPSPLIPQGFLADFVDAAAPSTDLEVTDNSILLSSNGQSSESSEPKDAHLIEFYSNIQQVIFFCLMGLGDLNRNAAKIHASYVVPSLSSAANKKSKHGIDKRNREAYQSSLECYSKCIGLLPTISDPYNCIGVIENSLGNIFQTALWFLRSQFTRDNNTASGKLNLSRLFTKSRVEEAYTSIVSKPRDQMSIENVNIILLRIFGEYFYPKAHERPIYTEKVEADFVDILFSNQFKVSSEVFEISIMDYLTVFICSCSLAERDQVTREKIGNFFVRFISSYLKKLRSNSGFDFSLGNIRLILAWLRANAFFRKNHGTKIIKPISDTLNSILDTLESKDQVTLFCTSGEAPIRAHYFKEDVRFKDFVPIGSQFKDFNDDHLFLSQNVHLLFGSGINAKNGIPLFLDNDAVHRINKVQELSQAQSAKAAIMEECSNYENLSRLKASVHMLFKLFPTHVSLSEENVILVKTMEEPAKSDVQKDKTKSKRKNKSKTKESQVEKAHHDKSHVEKSHVEKISLEEQLKPVAPTSIKDIESMIIGHAPKLNKQPERYDRSFEDMVDSIVSEDEMADEVQVPSTMEPKASTGIEPSTVKMMHRQPQEPPSQSPMGPPIYSTPPQPSVIYSQPFQMPMQTPYFGHNTQNMGQIPGQMPSQNHSMGQVPAQNLPGQNVPAQNFPAQGQLPTHPYPQYAQGSHMYMAPGWYGYVPPVPPNTSSGNQAMYSQNYNGQNPPMGPVPGSAPAHSEYSRSAHPTSNAHNGQNASQLGNYMYPQYHQQ